MGYYVNPKNESKESFLERMGIVVNPPLKWEDIPEGFMVVCLVRNPMFSAAAIAYCPQELEYFQFGSRTDIRPKIYFMVKREELLKVSDLARYQG